MAPLQQRTLLDEITAHEATLERLRSVEAAYERFVPRQFLHLMGFEDIREVCPGDQVERSLAILFADIRDFTNLSESITPQESFNFLNSYLSEMQPAVAAHGGVIDKYVGDAILALFPGPSDEALRGAVAILNQLDIYNAGRDRAGYIPIRIGIGINTGVVMLGTVGSASRMDVTVIGDAVNLAARLERITREWDVSLLISDHTLLGLEDPETFCIRFIDRRRVRGKQEIQSIYEVCDADPAALRMAKRAMHHTFETALACFHLGYPEDARPLLEECVAAAPQDNPARLYLEKCQHQVNNPVDVRRPWRDDFRTGIDHLDEDLRLLVDMANAIIADLLVGDRSGTAEAIARFAETLDTHFEVEQALMEKSDYPFMLDHARAHRRLRQSVQEFAAVATAGKDDYRYVAFTGQRIVADWLIDHIVKADRALGNHLLRQNIPV